MTAKKPNILLNERLDINLLLRTLTKLSAIKTETATRTHKIPASFRKIMLFAGKSGFNT